MNLRKLTSSLLLIIVPMVYAQSQSFTPEDLWKLKRLNFTGISPDESQVLYQSTVYDIEENKGESTYYIYNLNENKNKKIAEDFDKIKQLRWTSEGVAGITTKDKQKEIITSSLEKPDFHVLLTRDSKKLLDFKISPNGDYLLTLEKVKTRNSIEDAHPKYAKADVKIYDDLMYRHWDHWQDEYSDQLILYKIKDGKAQSEGINLLDGTKFDGIMEPFGGLGNVIFHDNKILYVSKKKLGKDYATSTNTEIYVYDITTKETSNSTTGSKGYDTHPRINEASNQLAWLSMKTDGFESDKNDIIVRDLKTKKDKNLTADIDLTVADFVWNKKGDKIYFLAVKEATYQLFELDVKTSKYRQVSEGDHDFRGVGLANGNLIAMRQSMLTPNELFKVDIKSGKAEQLTHANDEFLKGFDAPTIEKRWINTTDNKKMLTWVILPPNFDENKKYPALLYCQGGPQAPVSQFFSFRWNFRLMASQGYIVVAPNRRGLPGFGKEWNDAISKDWGGQSIKDYLSAIDAVSKDDYVDSTRLGAVGASYGGYSVYFLAGNHEGRFKTFIAHDGVFDLKSWYGTTEELFFANWDLGGPYWDKKNEKTYTQFNPINYVNNWNTPILIIQGGIDYRVPTGQGLEAFQAAQLKGIKSKLLYFPHENHWILSPQNAMVWQHEFFNWLKETL